MGAAGGSIVNSRWVGSGSVGTAGGSVELSVNRHTLLTGVDKTVHYFVYALATVPSRRNPRNLLSSSVKDHTHHNLSRSY